MRNELRKLLLAWDPEEFVPNRLEHVLTLAEEAERKSLETLIAPVLVHAGVDREGYCMESRLLTMGLILEEAGYAVKYMVLNDDGWLHVGQYVIDSEVKKEIRGGAIETSPWKLIETMTQEGNKAGALFTLHVIHGSHPRWACKVRDILDDEDFEHYCRQLSDETYHALLEVVRGVNWNIERHGCKVSDRAFTLVVGENLRRAGYGFQYKFDADYEVGCLHVGPYVVGPDRITRGSSELSVVSPGMIAESIMTTHDRDEALFVLAHTAWMNAPWKQYLNAMLADPLVELEEYQERTCNTQKS